MLQRVWMWDVYSLDRLAVEEKVTSTVVACSLSEGRMNGGGARGGEGEGEGRRERKFHNYARAQTTTL